MRVNIEKIARQAGVSIATVSRAINGKGPMREETRKRILQLVDEYHYVPNPNARGLSGKFTETIGIILPELTDEFFMNVIHAIDEEAYRENRYVLVASSHGQRDAVETLIQFMGSGRVDGVILMVPKIQDEIMDVINRSKRPIVLMNSSKSLKSVISFDINNFQGSFAITEHLIGHGYESIGMMTGPEGNCDAEERYKGFAAALKAHGIDQVDSLIVSGDFTARSGYHGLTRLMSQRRKPRAIFAANDMMAVGAFEAARNLHIRIPEDVAIVGFDDISLGHFLLPSLTTVHVPIQELGSKAIRYLLKLIKKEVDPDVPYREEISTGIVIGGSCGCASTSFQSFYD